MRCEQFILSLFCAISLGCSSSFVSPSLSQSNTVSSGDEAFARAFEQGTSEVLLEGQGVVQRILSDDNDGRRHQRFIVKLFSGQSILISHNIDLARRVESLREGDTVSFSGEYAWNAEGGVMHWTHLDPRKSHAPGWIKHNGIVYQ